MGPDWDWQLSVEVYGRKLQGIIAELFVLMGMAGGQVPKTVSRAQRLAVLEILRPAEAALRRVIVMAMLGIGVIDGVRKRRARPAPRKMPLKDAPRGEADRAPVFPLFDPRMWLGGILRPRKRRRGPGPRITVVGVDRYVPYVPPPLPLSDDTLDAASLVRRLRAMQAALDDIPAQARRLARLIARRKARAKPGVVRPMRYARPPGHRAGGKRDVDEILADCQYLALFAMYEAERAAG